MKTMLAATLLTGAVLLTVTPARAGGLGDLFDLSLRWGATGFTLDGHVNGPAGPLSGMLRGGLRRGGVTVDGWVDDRGRTRTFELDANVLDGIFRAVVRDSPERI